MLFDADVLISYLRRNDRAIRAVDSAIERELSAVTYMELVQGVRDKRELQEVKAFVPDLGFRTLPLTESIGRRAAAYLEEYVLRIRLGVVDALVAATAVENDLTLLTGNVRHYKAITELEVKAFRG